MGARENADLAALWSEPTHSGRELGGLRHHGISPEFNKIIDFIVSFVNIASESPPSKWALLLEDWDGKSTFAISVKNELSRRTIQAAVLDGKKPASFGKDFSRQGGVLIVDDLPLTLEQRDKAAAKIQAYPGSVLLFTRSKYQRERCLSQFSKYFELPSSELRPIDKLCRLIGAISEKAQSRFQDESLDTKALLSYLPPKTMHQFCITSWAQGMRSIDKIANFILDRIETARISGKSLLDADQLFFDLVDHQRQNGTLRTSSGSQHRLFVEGTSDRDLLLLAARIDFSSSGFDWIAGLDIQVMGGTSQIPKIIREQSPDPERDIFLLDQDKDGEHGAEKLKKFDQNYLFLPKDFARHPAQANGTLEIEDLLSLACIDDFYSQQTTLQPEAEFLYYQYKISRRVQVYGPDKEQFVEWLSKNGTIEDMERLLYVLGMIRDRLGLILPQGRDLPTWSRTLCANSHRTAQLGHRKSPWWPPT